MKKQVTALLCGRRRAQKRVTTSAARLAFEICTLNKCTSRVPFAFRGGVCVPHAYPPSPHQSLAAFPNFIITVQ